MGFFSSKPAGSEESSPDLSKKSGRKLCWDARDKYFECLDKNDIENPVKNAQQASAKCGKEDTQFNKDCIESWVSYFKEKRIVDIAKEKQLKLLQAQGATKMDQAVNFR